MNAIKPFALTACFLLLPGMGVSAAADPTDNNFHGDKLPEPPSQHAIWTPPDGAPKEPAGATSLLFDQGLADPRGCEYCEIKIAAGMMFKNPAGALPVVHGWVLPADAAGAQRFAVCWDGLVYPVLEVGKPCSLDEDVAALLKYMQDPRKNAMYAISRSGGTAEEISLAFDTPLAVKAALLLRIGKGEAASAVMTYLSESRGGYYQPRSIRNSDSEPEEKMAESLRTALLDRAVCAHVRGDDVMALLSLRQLAHFNTAVEDAIVHANPTHVRQDQTTIQYEEMIANAYLADAENRAREAPHKSALELGRASFATKEEWIKALIADLENVRDTRWQISVPSKMDPIMEALAQEGDDAVEPLLQCLINDERFTRAVDSHIGMSMPDPMSVRQLIRVNEVAYEVLKHITGTYFHDAIVKYNLAYSTPAQRMELAAEIRAYWDKYKGMSEQERWYNILSDDSQNADRWKEVAEKITRVLFDDEIPAAQKAPQGQPQKHVLAGESLRDKRPGVTELIAKRIRQIAADTTITVNYRFQDIVPMLDELLTWDPAGGTETALWACNTLAPQWEPSPENAGWAISEKIVPRLMDLGHPEALEGAAKMLRQSTPSAEAPGINLLWLYRDQPAMKKVAASLFGSPRSPWPVYFREPSSWRKDPNWVGRFDLLSTPLAGIPEFRAMMLAGLADHRPVCKSLGFGDRWGGGEWVVALKGTEDSDDDTPLMEEYDPRAAKGPAPGMLRVCDIFASGVQHLDGAAPFPVFLPEKERDRVITQYIDLLQRYGDHFTYVKDAWDTRDDIASRGNQDAPTLVFSKLDHPATAQDLKAGRAIFALPAGTKARLLPMLRFPMLSRWKQGDTEEAQWMDFYAPGKSKKADDKENNGAVWQAEEGFVDGKWRRFYGYVGANGVARVPAEEIEFLTDGNSIGLLDHSLDLDFRLEPQTQWQNMKAGGPVTIRCLLYNRSGLDQSIPGDPLYDAAKKALADGVRIHLYQRVKGEQNMNFYDSAERNDPDGTWAEMPMKKTGVFQVKEAGRLLKAGEDWEAMAFDLRDFFDVKEPGEYFLNFTFDAGKLKFTGGATRYVRLVLLPVATAMK